MKIAIPTVNGKLSAHFGHCETFALLTVADEGGQVLSEEHVAPPQHEPGALPRALSEWGVDVVIAGGMGGRAQQMMQDDFGMKVVVGAPAEEPAALVDAYLKGTLTGGVNVCDH